MQGGRGRELALRKELLLAGMMTLVRSGLVHSCLVGEEGDRSWPQCTMRDAGVGDKEEVENVGDDDEEGLDE